MPLWLLVKKLKLEVITNQKEELTKLLSLMSECWLQIFKTQSFLLQIDFTEIKKQRNEEIKFSI